ncbi:hypothetical protein Bra3105_01705 [Brachybacterium halotolerans subsp. kimchii]|uniref:hypothetical protein n=1 Tax=Brachybacterium halotolerans TaxID=2795215 RepID=UPI001E4104D9|nr:hypothetical protein [Brachybacterium halotolerans]UEJ83072.1 hypothetical protein Bra3105_01705 [Brachybacterium halotolerans subsp. kimchii]
MAAAPQSPGRSTPSCPVAGTWALTGATDPVLLGTGQEGHSPALAKRWVHEDPSAPPSGFATAAGAKLGISSDGVFTETVDGATSTAWWELDGTLLDTPAPSEGRVIAEGDALHLVPRAGIGRVSYEVDGVLHGADTTTVSDRLTLDRDGTLLRTVSVSQDAGDVLGRTWYRYVRTTSGSHPSATAAAAGSDSAPTSGPREVRDVPGLEDGLRLEIPTDLAAAILADHARAERLDRENTVARAQGASGAAAWSSADGIADLRLLLLDALAPQSVRQISGGSVRMSDGKVLRGPAPSADGRDDLRPAPERSMLPVLKDRLAPLLAGCLPRPGRPRAEIGSLLVADPARQEVRWVLFMGRAAALWNEAIRDGFPYRRCLDLARELRDIDPERLRRRLPALPAVLLDETVSRAHPDVILEVAAALAAPTDESHLRALYAEDEPAPSEEADSAPVSPTLWNAVRLDLPADRAAVIRDQQREALRVDAEHSLQTHVERGTRFTSPEKRGIAKMQTISLERRNGEARMGTRTGLVHRLRDCRGLARPGRRGFRRHVPHGWPRPGEFADFVLEFEVAPALAEIALGPADGSVADFGSLQVLDLRTGEVRWVLFLGEAAEGWERAVRAAMLEDTAIELGRELQAMSAEEFARRIPPLPITLHDALTDLEPLPGIEIPGRSEENPG